MRRAIKWVFIYLAGISTVFFIPKTSYPYPPGDAMIVTGIMRCAPAVSSANDFYDMYGCNSNDGVLSIQKFFDRYKRNEQDWIIKIHYDALQNLIHIYYGRLNGLPPQETD